MTSMSWKSPEGVSKVMRRRLSLGLRNIQEVGRGGRGQERGGELTAGESKNTAEDGGPAVTNRVFLTDSVVGK